MPVATELPIRSNRVLRHTHTFGSMRDLAEWPYVGSNGPGLTGLDEGLAPQYGVAGSTSSTGYRPSLRH